MSSSTVSASILPVTRQTRASLNRLGTVAVLLGPEADLVAKGIDQPGLTTGLLEDVIDHPILERLSGRFGVLGVEESNLLLVEVPQSQRFGFDIEGAAAGDDLVVAVMDAVIPDIPHTA